MKNSIISSDVDQPYGLCAFGHQGKMHDEATPGLKYNNQRMYHTRLGRFPQRDPIGYPDGLNPYAGYHILHGGVDPSGEWVTYVIGAAIGAGLDIAVQVYVEGKDWGEISWKSVVISGASGAIGAGIGTAATKVTAKIAGKYCLKKGSEMAIKAGLSGTGGAVAGILQKSSENYIEGKPILEGTGGAALYGSAFTALGSLADDGIFMLGKKVQGHMRNVAIEELDFDSYLLSRSFWGNNAHLVNNNGGLMTAFGNITGHTVSNSTGLFPQQIEDLPKEVRIELIWEIQAKFRLVNPSLFLDPWDHEHDKPIPGGWPHPLPPGR